MKFSQKISQILFSTKKNEIEVPSLPKAILLTDENIKRRGWQPLKKIEWRIPSEAKPMQSDAPVLGLYLNGKAWTIPCRIVQEPHMVNLFLDESPILVTFCSVCWSGAAFDPILQGEQHTFRLAGQYNGGLLIADLETGSLWSPLTGEALHGPLKGTTLARLPVYLTTWSEWLNEHPTSLVLYASMIYKQRTYYTRIKNVLLNLLRSLRVVRGKKLYKSLLQPIDERLPANQLVLGVESNGIAKAYPLSALDKTQSVINDTLGNSEIVVFHKPETWTAIAFSRQLGNEVLVFDSRTEDGNIIDQNTGSYWNYAGNAYHGELAGHKLSFIFSGVEKWYSWAAYHPHTNIFNE